MTDLDDNLDNWAEVKDECDWSGLLLGNGFSQNMWTSFGYHSLFETASAGAGPTLSADDVALFDRFGTKISNGCLAHWRQAKLYCTRWVKHMS